MFHPTNNTDLIKNERQKFRLGPTALALPPSSSILSVIRIDSLHRLPSMRTCSACWSTLWTNMTVKVSPMRLKPHRSSLSTTMKQSWHNFSQIISKNSETCKYYRKLGLNYRILYQLQRPMVYSTLLSCDVLMSYTCLDHSSLVKRETA